MNPQPMNSNPTYSVLIVEDQEDLRTLLVTIMTRLGGFRTFAAADGVEGLEAVEKYHPDCLVIDVLMPNIDGFQLVKLLRGDPATASIPIIMLTALAQEINQFRGLALGADRYLLKPARPAQVVAAVREALQVTEQQRRAQQQRLAALDPPHASDH